MFIFSASEQSVRSSVLFVVFILCSSVFAQPFEWVKINKSHSSAYAEVMAVSDNGFVYTAGRFRDTLDIDPGTGITNLGSEGADDIYIQKLNSLGNFSWGKRIGNNRNQTVNGMALDNSGNVIICGTFFNTVDFDPGIGTFNLEAGEMEYASYILKLSPIGNFLWAKIIKGNKDVSANSLFVDASGNVVIVGEFEGTADFNPSTGLYELSASSSRKNLFIQKLNNSGSFIWAKKIGGGIGHTVAKDVFIDNNQLYITGSFINQVDFDPGTGVQNLNAGNSNLPASFVLRLDSIGNYVWANEIYSQAACTGLTITVKNNHVYAGGHFRGTADFDPGSNTEELSSTSTKNGYVQKLTKNGDFVWVRGTLSLGSAKSEIIDIAVEDDDKVIIFGTFTGDTDFDSSEEDLYISSNGSFDAFFQKFDADGDYIWVKKLGGPTPDDGNAMCMDISGNIYSTGNFSNQVDFDLGSSIHYKTASNTYDVFVHKMSQCESKDTIYPVACLIYNSPSDKFKWTESGIYKDYIKDTLLNDCYIQYQIDLTVKHVETGIYRDGDYFVSMADSATYQWYHCEHNFLPLPGETGKTFEIPQNDPYLVMVTQDGCTDTSDCVWVTNLAVMDLTVAAKPIVYYNDQTQYIGFELDHAMKGEVRLYDLYGRLLQSIELSEDETHYLLDVSMYTSGVYLVDYRKDGLSVQTNKVILH